mmetsp:Transcript_2528/g.8630  ORF Transcript_2528/g.8630 Transcript_2528/m.8630 type:complete len:322 (+) Transcript_2528:26-991(+)
MKAPSSKSSASSASASAPAPASATSAVAWSMMFSPSPSCWDPAASWRCSADDAARVAASASRSSPVCECSAASASRRPRTVGASAARRGSHTPSSRSRTVLMAAAEPGGRPWASAWEARRALYRSGYELCMSATTWQSCRWCFESAAAWRAMSAAPASLVPSVTASSSSNIDWVSPVSAESPALSAAHAPRNGVRAVPAAWKRLPAASSCSLAPAAAAARAVSRAALSASRSWRAVRSSCRRAVRVSAPPALVVTTFLKLARRLEYPGSTPAKGSSRRVGSGGGAHCISRDASNARMKSQRRRRAADRSRPRHTSCLRTPR